MNQKSIRKNYVKHVDIKVTIPETDDKKEKARLSAINTRKRKKAYIELLEQKIAMLQQQVSQKNEGKATLFGMMENFVNDRKYQFDMLETAYKAGDDRKINVVTNSLRFKYGISGQGRLALINKICELLIDSLLPMHMRYLFWVASENQDVFTREVGNNSEFYSFDFSDSQMNCLQSFGLEEVQIQKIQGLQEKIQRQRANYDNLIIQIYKLRETIQKEGQQCQEIVDTIWQCLKPKQSAELLIQLDKIRITQSKTSLSRMYYKNIRNESQIRSILLNFILLNEIRQQIMGRYEQLKQFFQLSYNEQSNILANRFHIFLYHRRKQIRSDTRIESNQTHNIRIKITNQRYIQSKKQNREIN